jgi:hypothetical protein
MPARVNSPRLVSDTGGPLLAAALAGLRRRRVKFRFPAFHLEGLCARFQDSGRLLQFAAERASLGRIGPTARGTDRHTAAKKSLCHRLDRTPGSKRSRWLPTVKLGRFTKDLESPAHIIERTAAMNITNDKLRNTIQTTGAMLVSVVATVLTTVLFLS